MPVSDSDGHIDGPAQAELPPPPSRLNLDECALLLDIDGTLLDFAPAPREVVVPKSLVPTLNGLLERTSGALALVSGRSLEDIDWMFAPARYPSIAGHGAEMRLSIDSEAVASAAPPMNPNLKRRFAAIAQLHPGILVEDKGYSIALHYRKAPQMDATIHDAVSAIRADLPKAPIEVLPGKRVCEIKPSGITKATGVRELMSHEPFKSRRPVFLGDDVTDETVFAIMPEFDGLSFSVGREAQGVAGTFAGPRDVRRWLSDLLNGTSGADH